MNGESLIISQRPTIIIGLNKSELPALMYCHQRKRSITVVPVLLELMEEKTANISTVFSDNSCIELYAPLE